MSVHDKHYFSKIICPRIERITANKELYCVKVETSKKICFEYAKDNMLNFKFRHFYLKLKYAQQVNLFVIPTLHK